MSHPRRSKAILLGLLPAVVALPATLSGAGESTEAYLSGIAAKRVEREEGLRSEYGWLTLAGLFWLERGANAFGSDGANPVVLPGQATPARAGVLNYDGTTVTLEPAPESGLTVNGEPAQGPRVLKDDGEGEPDVLQIGQIRFYVIERSARHGVRVKDPASPVRTGFRGLDFFPADPKWRREAVLKKFDEPRAVPIQDVLGSTSTMYAPGLLEFELDGRPYSLLPLVDKPGETDLFIMFRDETTGHETYGAGRYLSATLEGDRAVLDFNLAYNPPCSFTSFATCPLPPRENRLGLRIEAGERRYGDH